jgi:hypothetical protein
MTYTYDDLDRAFYEAVYDMLVEHAGAIPNATSVSPLVPSNLHSVLKCRVHGTAYAHPAHVQPRTRTRTGSSEGSLSQGPGTPGSHLALTSDQRHCIAHVELRSDAHRPFT